VLTTFLWITGDPPPLLISICPPKPLNQLNRLNLTQHFQNPKKTGTYVVFRGPRARNNISFVTPSLPLAGERGAGGGWRTMCPPSAIDIIGIFGISAIVPTNAPTTAGRFDSPRAAAECRHLRLFLQTRATRSLPAVLIGLPFYGCQSLPGSQARGGDGRGRVRTARKGAAVNSQRGVDAPSQRMPPRFVKSKRGILASGRFARSGPASIRLAASSAPQSQCRACRRP